MIEPKEYTILKSVMIFTVHAVTGAAIGAALGNPAEGFAAGVVSHHIFDAIIHFDQGTLHNEPTGPNYLNNRFFVPRIPYTRLDWAILFADFAVAGLIFVFIFLSRPIEALPAIIAGTMGGLFPDFLNSSPLWSEKLKKKSKLVAKYGAWHTFFHWTAGPKQKILGLLTQTFLVAAALRVLF